MLTKMKQKLLLKTFVSVLIAIILFPFNSISTSASLGVGVDTGEIVIDEMLNPGFSYSLPPITVINTGETAAQYSMSVENAEDKKKLNPEKDWFVFNPETFFLEPGQKQKVEIKMNLPVTRIKLGEYFVFLTAQPLTELGTVGVAAGTKLHFTVEAANIVQFIFYKISDVFSSYQPWSTITIIFHFLLIAIVTLRKRFKFEIINSRKKVKSEI